MTTRARSSQQDSTCCDRSSFKDPQREATHQARLSQHLKDVRLILAAAGRTGTDLPLSILHRELLERVEAAGGGELDNSAILRAFGGKQSP